MFYCICSVYHLVLQVLLSSCGLFVFLFFIFKAVSYGVVGYSRLVLNSGSFRFSPSVLELHIGNKHTLSPTILMCYFQDLSSSDFLGLLLVFSFSFFFMLLTIFFNYCVQLVCSILGISSQLLDTFKIKP